MLIVCKDLCTFCKSSVVSALKFSTKHFPNLEKTIIYQELFYIFQENYGEYFKVAAEFM